MINENILFPKLFIIGVNGEKIGVMTREDALDSAQEQKLDLVLISTTPKPIARFMDYGRFKYDRKKKKKEEKQKQSRTENRQIRLTPLIGINDLKTKAKKAREFLLDGDIVKISLKFRGRESQRPELGYDTLNTFYKEVEDIAIITKEPFLTSGRFLDMFLQQDKKKVIQMNKENKNKNKEVDNHAENEN
ncbi:MAG: translation initiation factor IF-3 [Metamycoplasmataceae bacterium]